MILKYVNNFNFNFNFNINLFMGIKPYKRFKLIDYYNFELLLIN